jgi:transcriptional regulator with XRE-family HTH domain
MRDVRESLGLTQEQLARLAAVSQGSVSRFENGRHGNIAALVVLELTVALARQCRGQAAHLQLQAFDGLLDELALIFGGEEEAPEAPPYTGARIRQGGIGVARHAVILREGRCWTIAYQGTTRALRDCVGLIYIANLVSSPGHNVHALVLLANSHGVPGASTGDGKGRPAVERARIRVTRAIRRAVARIAIVQPALGAHLGAAIRTGTHCTYRPGDSTPIRWDVTQTD